MFLYLISRVFIQFQCCDMFRWVFPFLILDLVENLFKFQIFQRLRRNAPRRRRIMEIHQWIFSQVFWCVVWLENVGHLFNKTQPL